jgi:hypothetical protein
MDFGKIPPPPKEQDIPNINTNLRNALRYSSLLNTVNDQ